MSVQLLTAVVRYGRGKSIRAKTVTHVTIQAGDVKVAEATLGGKYTPEQALREYRRLPGVNADQEVQRRADQEVQRS